MPPRVLLSRRKAKRLVRLYAIVVQDVDGFEGVVRAELPDATGAYVTDDPGLVGELLTLARAHYPTAYVSTFTRAE